MDDSAIGIYGGQLKFPSQMRMAGNLYEGTVEGFDFMKASLSQSHIDTLAQIVPGWTPMIYVSSVPLANEIVFGAESFSYFFLYRQGEGNRFLLAGRSQALVQSFLNNIGVSDRVATPTVFVDRMVSDLTENPSKYVLANVWARIDRYGRSLKTTAFYGDDLANAKLFKEILPETVPYRACLVDVVDDRRILTIASRGEVSFHFWTTNQIGIDRSNNALQKIDRVLRFISEKKYMSWISDNKKG